jgi:tetraacyldisaccharide 4'-kinase
MWRTPSFWFASDSFAAQALQPLSWAYAFGRRWHATRTDPQKVQVPVICIGNLTAGGSGKTPVVQGLFQLLINHNIARHPVILTRGYGSSEDLAYLTPERDEAYEKIGDEALLLARDFPVQVGADRVAGAQAAIKHGHDLILMDDGFQNPYLYKDISFLVVDGRLGFGNGRLLPAGPMREPLAEGIARAQGCVIIGDDTYGVNTLLPPDLPVFHAMTQSGFRPVPDQRYLAFCGIAHPSKFKRTLELCGVELAGFEIYPDHYPYTMRDIVTLLERVKAENVRLLTTDKDAVRLRQFDEIQPFLETVPLEIVWSDEDRLVTFLRRELQA